jgi:hypothetical protein
MKKIFMLLISGLIITSMAGVVLADIPVDDKLISDSDSNPNAIVAPAGTPTPVYINLASNITNDVDPNSAHEIKVVLSVTTPTITVTLPTGMKDAQNQNVYWVDSSNNQMYTLTSDRPVAYLKNQKFNGKILTLSCLTSSSQASGGLAVYVDEESHCKYEYIETDYDPITASVPEFPTVALPVAAVLGLLFIVGRKKEKV